jgi:hypothetical protein
MIEIDYDKLADAIVKRLRLLPPADKIIWTADQCADYLGISRRHYVDRMSKTWGFPAAIKLPTDTGHAAMTAGMQQTYSNGLRSTKRQSNTMESKKPVQ